MDHFADDVMQKTSYQDGSEPERRGVSISHTFRDSDAAGYRVPSMSTHDSEIIRSLWQRKQNNMSTIFWIDIEGDPLHPIKAEKTTVLKRLLLMCGEYLISLAPFMKWVRLLNVETIKADLVAGLSVGMMIIPQSMSYANIAGLDVKYGLYSSVMPIIVYAFLGTSRHLAVGPVALVSLLVNVGLAGQLTEEECPAYYAQKNSSISEADWRQQGELCPDEYAKLAILTSLLVGVFQVLASFLRLGFLVAFLGHPVVSGFTSGAAITIGLSQIKDLLGVSIPKSQYIYETIQYVFEKIDQTKYFTLLMGLTWWFMLWAARKLAVKYKARLSWLRACAPLIVCTIGIFIGATWSELGGCNFEYCDKDSKPKYIVGDIPAGFPQYSGDWDFGKIGRVIPTAFSASLIGYMESIAIAKSLAAKHRYEVIPGQELFALGIANIVGSFTSSYPVTGSFSRSAVNNMTGGKTNLSGAITGLLVVIVLMFVTAPFKFLPKFCLAAIVISSVTNLIDYPEAIHLWKIKKADFCLWVAALLGTLFLGVLNGLILAIIGSLVIVIYESVRPQIAILWRLPETPIYRSVKQVPNSITINRRFLPTLAANELIVESLGQFVPGILIVRLGASMYFANVAYIRDHILQLVHDFSGGLQNAALTSHPVKYIIIEMTPVISVDSTAVHMIEDMHRDLKERGIRIAFATVGNRVEQTLRRAGTIDKHQNKTHHPENGVGVKPRTSRGIGDLEVQLEEEEVGSGDVQQARCRWKDMLHIFVSANSIIWHLNAFTLISSCEHANPNTQSCLSVSAGGRSVSDGRTELGGYASELDMAALEASQRANGTAPKSARASEDTTLAI